MRPPAMRQWIERRGWDFGIFDESEPRARSHEKYAILNASPDSDRIDAIHVLRWGRFGNSFAQLGLALKFCLDHGVGRMFVPPGHPLFTPGQIAGIDVAIVRGSGEIPRDCRNVVSGRFFYGYGFYPAGVTPDSIDALLVEALPGYLDSYRASIRPLPADTLVCHFRGGDIFSTEIHPGYGQPPASFYMLAVEETGAREVVIVSEDDSNPAMAELVSALSRAGIAFRLESNTLLDDVRLLCGAETVVSSFGTFVWAAALISPFMKSLWFFHRFRSGGCLSRGIALHRVIDDGGDYVASMVQNNWRNTEEQRRLMVEYPAERLRAMMVAPGR